MRWSANVHLPTRTLASVQSFTVAASLVALGRLAYEKGFDVLLRAMPAVLARHDAHLAVYGEGAERAALGAQITALGLQRNVSLMGDTLDPLAALEDADVFVFPSRPKALVWRWSRRWLAAVRSWPAIARTVRRKSCSKAG